MVEQKLFGDEPAPRKKKAAAPTESDGAVARLFDAYHRAFLRRWNQCAAHGLLDCRRCGAELTLRDPDEAHAVKPLYEGGRDAKSFRTLADAWGEPVVVNLITAFFASTDPQVTRSDYKVKVFFQHAQRLRLLAQQGHGQDQRTVENLDAARRATRDR